MFPLELPPGVVDTPTKTAKSANWAETHLIRWVDKKLTPVGGWERVNYTAFASRVRAIHTWTVLSGIQMTAYLCEGHCYVDQGDGLLTNISPVVPIVPPFAGAGIVGGYGDNLYNLDTYGTPRPNKSDVKPVTPGYQADNWGEDLIVMTGNDGRLLRWKPSTPATPLVAVTGAPVGNRLFVVTPQRHLMLFGAGGIFNRFAWSDQEDIEDWNYASTTNLAGFFDVQPAAPIIAASVAGDDIVFWTSAGDMFVSRNIGLPYIYNCDLVATGSVPISPSSLRDTPIGLVWVSSNGFWRFEGGSASPVACPVWSWITKSFDEFYARYNATMVPIDTFSEVWWFFPDADNQFANKYVMWNYKEGWWSQGRLGRVCGASSSYTRSPYMSDGTSIFKHESGNFYIMTDEDLPWAKTFNMNIDSGSVLSTFRRLLPDVEGPIDNIAFQLDYNIPRAGVNHQYSSGEKSMEADGFVPFRDTGRDFRLTVKQMYNGIAPWTVGENKVDLMKRGGQ